MECITKKLMKICVSPEPNPTDWPLVGLAITIFDQIGTTRSTTHLEVMPPNQESQLAVQKYNFLHCKTMCCVCIIDMPFTFSLTFISQSSKECDMEAPLCSTVRG